MPIDDLSRRRFEMNVNLLGSQHTRFSTAFKELNDSAQLMYTLLSGNLDLVERALGGATPETIRMRSEVEQAWSALTADTVMPALEAVIEHFSTASTDLAQYVGSLPSSGGSAP